MLSFRYHELFLSVGFAEFLHEVSQLLAALIRHGVVDGSTHTAYGTVSLYAAQLVLQGFGNELLLQLLARQSEGYVHEGTAILVSMACVEAVAVVDGIIDQGSLFLLRSAMTSRPPCALSHLATLPTM